MNNMKLKLSLLIFVFLYSGMLLPINAAEFTKTYYDILALFIVGIVLLIFIGFMYYGMGEGKPQREKERNKVFARFRQLITGAAPIEKEQEIMFEHSYDGIRELDNRIPPWFSWLFYITIFFAMYYLLDYHVLRTGILQEEEYAQEVKEAEQLRAELIRTGAFINEETVTLLNDQTSITSGRNIFSVNCTACHREDAGGLIGPNLTDEFWIHGGGIKDIFKTIKYGVPAKGMVSWQSQLNPKQIQEVTSFIIYLKGSNPANPKPPQGNKYAPADTTKAVALLNGTE